MYPHKVSLGLTLCELRKREKYATVLPPWQIPCFWCGWSWGCSGRQWRQGYLQIVVIYIIFGTGKLTKARIKGKYPEIKVSGSKAQPLPSFSMEQKDEPVLKSTYQYLRWSNVFCRHQQTRLEDRCWQMPGGGEDWMKDWGKAIIKMFCF